MAKTSASLFDRCRSGGTRAVGTVGGGIGLGYFRTTDKDKAPPSRVLTGELMGDPAPGRTIQHEPPKKSGRFSEMSEERRCPHTGKLRTHSGPILLTFKEYRDYYGDEV